MMAAEIDYTQPGTPARDIAILCEDGFAQGTTIHVDGLAVDNVVRAEWSVEVGGPARATLYCEVVPGQFEASAVRFLPAKGTSFRDRLRLVWLVLRGGQ